MTDQQQAKIYYRVKCCASSHLFLPRLPPRRVRRCGRSLPSGVGELGAERAPPIGLWLSSRLRWGDDGGPRLSAALPPAVTMKNKKTCARGNSMPLIMKGSHGARFRGTLQDYNTTELENVHCGVCIGLGEWPLHSTRLAICHHHMRDSSKRYLVRSKLPFRHTLTFSGQREQNPVLQ